MIEVCQLQSRGMPDRQSVESVTLVAEVVGVLSQNRRWFLSVGLGVLRPDPWTGEVKACLVNLLAGQVTMPVDC